MSVTRDQVIVAAVFGALGVLWKLLRGIWRKRSEQTTFCYCPTCHNELCADEWTDCYDRGNSRYAYICSQCRTQSVFAFDAPVPVLIDVMEKHP